MTTRSRGGRLAPPADEVFAARKREPVPHEFVLEASNAAKKPRARR